jgi:hypothetical protein
MATETATWKSWVEGSSWDIPNVQNEIRKYCYTNNIEVLDIHIEKAGFLRKTCFFELRGDKDKILFLQKSLKSLE